MGFTSTLSEEDKKTARQQLGEYAGSIDSAITILRDRIALEPALKADTSAEFLVRFLRARKYDIDRAFLMVKSYYSARNQPLMQDLKPSALAKAIDLCTSCVMEGYHPEDRTKVVVVRPGLWNGQADFPFKDIIRNNLLTMEHVLKDEVVQVHGVRVVLDTSDVGWDHAKEVAKGYPAQMFRIMQDCIPIRLKGVHYINEPPMMSNIISLIKPFMREKMINRLNFHGTDLDDLYKHIPREMLPQHLGGTQPPLPHANFQEAIRGSEQYFLDMGQYYLDEPKVLFSGDSGDAKDTGVSGTYRKLGND